MEKIIVWANEWGGLASVAGLVLSLIGFGITIITVRRSRTAAERAQHAAENVRRTIVHTNVIADFSEALTIMEEVKRLQREGAWRTLLERYPALRKKLIVIRGIALDMGETDSATIQGAIQHFSNIENEVEKALASSKTPTNLVKMNEIVSNQIDRLMEVITRLKNTRGGAADGE